MFTSSHVILILHKHQWVTSLNNFSLSQKTKYTLYTWIVCLLQIALTMASFYFIQTSAVRLEMNPGRIMTAITSSTPPTVLSYDTAISRDFSKPQNAGALKLTVASLCADRINAHYSSGFDQC